MHTKLGLSILFIILTLNINKYAFAQYRWVDSKGHTSYSDSPPPVKEKVKNVNIITFVKSKNKTLPLMQQTTKPTEGTVPASSVVETKKSFLYDKQVCEQLEGYLRILQDGGNIAKLKSNGEKSFLDDKDKAKEVGDTQKRINEQCKKSM